MKIEQEVLTGERALFQQSGLHITDTVFQDGESPLKECRDIEMERGVFKWKYPLWYSRDITVKDSSWREMARAGVWYTDNVSVEDSLIEAPKNFRRCKGVSLRRVSIPNAQETFWNCSDVTLEDVSVKGDYFGMNSENLKIDGLKLVGGYAFDGIKNAEIRNVQLLTKDAFWNSENVTVYDSFISGEYLGWNAKNLTLINCTVESNQGMCYIENLVMKNCRLLNTDLAFEYSTVDVEVTGSIDSIKNPYGGTIKADSINEIIMEEVDVSKTEITCGSDKEILCKAI